MLLSQSVTDALQTFLKRSDQHRVNFMLSSGHSLMAVKIGVHNPLSMSLTNVQGEEVYFATGAVVAAEALPQPDPFDLGADPLASSDPNAAEWQRLFMALRAACDKSLDADVVAAVAALDEIEVRGS